MARIDLPHVNGIIGRDGRVRYYFRKRGSKNVRLLPRPIVMSLALQALSRTSTRRATAHGSRV